MSSVALDSNSLEATPAVEQVQLSAQEKRIYGRLQHDMIQYHVLPVSQRGERRADAIDVQDRFRNHFNEIYKVSLHHKATSC